MAQEIIISGFGGQGVMSMGQLLTYAGMLEGKHVSWLPSYGPEMRGGTANCSVILADDMIGSPVVTEATALMAMNQPSLEKFERTLISGGLLIVNSSLVNKKAIRDDIDVYYIPANEIADQLGNIRVANMVMLGAYLEKTRGIAPDSVMESLRAVLGSSKEHLIPINRKALEMGAGLVRPANQPI
ncbi:MAG TPA: 2-oxoacid:acceptor oxidoreductase family protein [Clostridia bacterium]|nr:2-oxoacid:acceptor oxidoreductase family protein [Clostridia bacterium]